MFARLRLRLGPRAEATESSRGVLAEPPKPAGHLPLLQYVTENYSVPGTWLGTLSDYVDYDLSPFIWLRHIIHTTRSIPYFHETTQTYINLTAV